MQFVRIWPKDGEFLGSSCQLISEMIVRDVIDLVVVNLQNIAIKWVGMGARLKERVWCVYEMTFGGQQHPR